MMEPVRLGIVGLGVMGSGHARNILAGKAGPLRLAAVADADPGRLAGFSEVAQFTSADDLIASGGVEAVLICTPHFSHPDIAIAALKAGLHVLVEKPVAVHVADCERMLAAPREDGQVLAAMFNQRTRPVFGKIRELIREGVLGEIKRIHWSITNWLRTDAYYASGGWRATWAGEGGGVLLNQAPHNLDLFYWLFGRPARVRAFCAFGKHHPIEVEDDVTAYLEMPNGATATFVTSTGEAPGCNRLEISGDLGRLVFEDDQLRLRLNRQPTSTFLRTSGAGFDKPEVWEVEVPIPKAPSGPTGHNAILANFAAAIRDRKPLIAPAADGLFSVELANAMLLSAWTDATVAMPLDGAVYQRALEARIDASAAAAPARAASDREALA